ncbi:TldD/PmbA family protein, partial [Escherichia coli]|nr:TldD/PmbA family protein [Escherichia coli]
MPVVFDRRVSAGLIGHFLGAIGGAAITRKTSFLLDRLGQQVFAKGVTIRDDPHRPRGLRSRPFDGEGLPVQPVKLVDAGM